MTYHYNLKLVHSGDRTELYHYQLAQQRGNPARNEKGRKGNQDGTTDKNKNRRQVLNAARNNIIRLVNSNKDLLSFITLTYAENMKDLSQSKADLHKCINKIQRNIKVFKYLYVLEYQERGAIHYHMLCNYPIDFECAKSNRRKPQCQKEAETRFMVDYWPYGFVDIRNLQEEGNTNVGLYVSTYIVKSLQDVNMNGYRVYGYSRNLNKPIEETMLIQTDIIDILQEMNKHYKVSYSNSYEQSIDYGDEIKVGTVNYFDLWRRNE